jgi:hypothetical protein
VFTRMLQSSESSTSRRGSGTPKLRANCIRVKSRHVVQAS